jgi:hypothetical protein
MGRGPGPHIGGICRSGRISTLRLRSAAREGGGECDYDKSDKRVMEFAWHRNSPFLKRWYLSTSATGPGKWSVVQVSRTIDRISTGSFEGPGAAA